MLTDGLQFPEGPVWASDGTLYVTETGGGRITAIAPDGSKRTFAETGGSPNGAALGPGGYLYVANNGGEEPGYIQRIDADGHIETLYGDCDGQAFHGPNDLAFDAHGGFYFTDPATQNGRESSPATSTTPSRTEPESRGSSTTSIFPTALPSILTVQPFM